MNGRKIAPQCVYCPAALEGVTQVNCELTGYRGFLKMLEALYVSSKPGLEHQEDILMSFCVALLSLNNFMLRRVYGQVCSESKVFFSKNWPEQEMASFPLI